MYHYGSRYFDSHLSRWISADPPLATGEYLPNGSKKHDANLPGMGGVFNSINLDGYQYAGQNPVKYVDPDGRHTEYRVKFKDIFRLGNSNIINQQFLVTVIKMVM